MAEKYQRCIDGKRRGAGDGATMPEIDPYNQEARLQVSIAITLPERA